MNRVDLSLVAFVLHEITVAEGATGQAIFNPLIAVHANTPEVRDEMLNHARKAVGYAEQLFTQAPVGKCLDDVLSAKHYLDDAIITVDGLRVVLNRLKGDLIHNLRDIEFVRIADDRRQLLDLERPFGNSVFAAFPLARQDLTEAHNCYAVECTTAAVFHLMRASEFSLRALARDRRVEFADKPLEQKEWGQILPSLERRVREWRDGTKPATSWVDATVRESQIQFYHDVIQELRSFNEAWRRHISHADALAFYDRDATKSIIENVRRFMNKLATRISEHSITPEFWVA